MDFTDALMVARGDLGVEMPLEKVPGIQKQITAHGAPRRQAGGGRDADARIDDHHPVPTRAKCRTSRPAIFEGADAVMLSAESAAGQYPVEAVSTMNRIAEEVETDATYRSIIDAQRTRAEATGADAIAEAARRSPRRSISRPSCAGPRPARPAAGRARAAAIADRGALADRGDRPPAFAGSGACTASSPRTRAISTTW
jgi:pyruvate kinase